MTETKRKPRAVQPKYKLICDEKDWLESSGFKFSWLDKIQEHRLKGTNKPLNEKELFNILFIEPLGTIDDIQARMNRIYRDYPDTKIDQPQATEVSKQLSWVMPKICSAIANENFIDIREYIGVQE